MNPNIFSPITMASRSQLQAFVWALAVRGAWRLLGMDDMQIVNGGQTTASIFAASQRDKADLSELSVAAKITVVPAPLIDDFVPQVSRYANSQNKVNEADFAANDPFHVSVEHKSRSIWAPAPEGTQRMTKWFYERARGQYADAVARQESLAQKESISRGIPPSTEIHEDRPSEVRTLLGPISPPCVKGCGEELP